MYARWFQEESFWFLWQWALKIIVRLKVSIKDAFLLHKNCFLVLPGFFVKIELISKKIWSSLSVEEVIVQRMTEGAQEVGILCPYFLLLLLLLFLTGTSVYVYSVSSDLSDPFYLCCLAAGSGSCSALCLAFPWYSSDSSNERLN